MMFQRFDPSGFTTNDQIRNATSVVDYVYRWVGYKFLSDEELKDIGLKNGSSVPEPNISAPILVENISFSDTKMCVKCGQMMQRTGTCWICSNCGDNEGGCFG